MGSEVDQRLVDVGTADTGVAAQGGFEDADGGHENLQVVLMNVNTLIIATHR